MAAPPSTTASAAASLPVAGTSQFRLGEDKNSDMSDDDQSEHSERNLSPQSGANSSKAKKKKARKQVGALAEELDTLLGAAFQAPNNDAVKSGPQVDNTNASTDQTMDIDTQKRPPKRTRQNMAKMEKRRLARQRRVLHQPPAQQAQQAQQKPLVPEGAQKKGKKQARRERKEKKRARRALGLGEKMAVD